MNTQGLWQLFLQTGRPEVWLAMRQQQEEEQAAPAFREERCDATGT